MTAFFDSITRLDLQILLFIQDHLRFEFLTPFWKGITHLGDKGIFWIILAVILLIPAKTRRAAVMAIISMGLGVVFTNLILKNAVARIRPYDLEAAIHLLVAEADDFSFPSGHTCASFCSALIYVRTLPKPWGVLTVILAVLIAFSRLYVGIHYPSDVIGGFLIAVVCSIITVKLFEIYNSGKKSGKQ